MTKPSQQLLTEWGTEMPVMDIGRMMVDPNMILLLSLFGFLLLYTGLLFVDTVLARRSRPSNTGGEGEEYLKSS